MTPEEKAKYLLFKMKQQQRGPGIEAAEGNAKRSALICCDEIVAEIEDLQQNCVMEFPLALAYWQQVKEAIQKL